MEFIPYSVLENFYYCLPDVKTFEGDCFHKDFEYDGKYYNVRFYKARDNGMQLWVFNPYWVNIVIKNGSHFSS